MPATGKAPWTAYYVVALFSLGVPTATSTVARASNDSTSTSSIYRDIHEHNALRTSTRTQADCHGAELLTSAPHYQDCLTDSSPPACNNYEVFPSGLTRNCIYNSGVGVCSTYMEGPSCTLPTVTTDGPTSSPTISPTSSPTISLEATGDPHLVNVRGDHFDVYQPGRLSLLCLPRSVEPLRALLLVEADAERMGGLCSVYFQAVTISGLWTNQTKPIQFLAKPKGTPEGRNWKEWMRFGPIDLKVTLRKKGVEYLNLYARNIARSEYEVGGLLGLDDHAAVEGVPTGCAHRHVAALVSSVAEAL